MQVALLDLGVKAFFIRTPNTAQDLCGDLVTIAERNSGASLCPDQQSASALAAGRDRARLLSGIHRGTPDDALSSRCSRGTAAAAEGC